MESRSAARLLPLLAALLPAVLASPGCCGLRYAEPLGDRDTPEAAFAYVREAFRRDLTGNQVDSLHPDFQEAAGINAGRYEMARTLRPGLFEDAAALLDRAVLESVSPPVPRATKGGPRASVEMVLLLPGGGRGTFLLVDEPVLLVATDDAGLGPARPVFHPLMDRDVRLEGGRLVVSIDRKLAVPPLEGSRIRRIEIHHDWLLYDIRSIDGLDALLEEARNATAESGPRAGGEGP